MSDTSNDYDDDEQQDEDDNLANLRRIAKDGKKAIGEAAGLRRELVLTKAGIDTETPLGKMFAKSYEGPDEIEAVKAAALEIGLLAPPKKSDADIQADQARAAEETRLREAQENLGGGNVGVPSGEEGPHPADAAIQHYAKLLTEGMGEQEARRDAVALLLSAGAKGDKRVLYSPAEHRARGLEEDRLTSGQG